MQVELAESQCAHGRDQKASIFFFFEQGVARRAWIPLLLDQAAHFAAPAFSCHYTTCLVGLFFSLVSMFVCCDLASPYGEWA